MTIFHSFHSSFLQLHSNQTNSLYVDFILSEPCFRDSSFSILQSNLTAKFIQLETLIWKLAENEDLEINLFGDKKNHEEKQN